MSLRRIAFRVAFPVVAGETWDIIKDVQGIQNIDQVLAKTESRIHNELGHGEIFPALEELKTVVLECFNKAFQKSFKAEDEIFMLDWETLDSTALIHELLHEAIDPGFYDRKSEPSSPSELEAHYHEDLLREYQPKDGNFPSIAVAQWLEGVEKKNPGKNTKQLLDLVLADMNLAGEFQGVLRKAFKAGVGALEGGEASSWADFVEIFTSSLTRSRELNQEGLSTPDMEKRLKMFTLLLQKRVNSWEREKFPASSS